MPGGPTSPLPSDWFAVKRDVESSTQGLDGMEENGGDLQRLPSPSPRSHISTYFNIFNETSSSPWVYTIES